MRTRAARPVRRLGPDDWEAAALDAIERGGLGAVSIVPLARTLRVTKGSFYWHYESRDELIAAALARWERIHTTEMLEAFAAIADPRERIRALFERVGEREPTVHARLAVAAADPLVAPVLERVSESRLAALSATFREFGLTPAAARDRAALAYATYMGLAQLRRDSPRRYASPAARRRLGQQAAAGLLEGCA